MDKSASWLSLLDDPGSATELGRLEPNDYHALIAQGFNELKTIFNNSCDGIAILDGETTRFLECNSAYLKLTGFQRDELLTKTCLELTAPEDLSKTKAVRQEVLEKGGVDFFEKTCEVAGGRQIKVQMSLTLLPDKKRTLIIVRDMTEHHQQRLQLQLSGTVFENTAEGILITDAEATILSVNPAFEKITGYSKLEAIGQKPNILKSNHHDSRFYTELWKTLLSVGRWKGEVWNRAQDGRLYVQSQTITAVRDDQDRIIQFVSVFSDITEFKKQEEAVQHLAYHDPLTGLPNRLLFQDRIQHALERAKRDRYRLALFFLDLDRFKQINDTLGHNIGDMLLQNVANRIVGICRSEDTVARLGGDEFVVLMEGFKNSDTLAHIAKKIIESLSRTMELEGHTIQISTSIGIALYPDSDTHVIGLMKDADMAMYAAKQAGRGTYRFYDDAMNKETTEKMEMEMELRQAIENEELELYYQPKVMLDENRPYGAEALVRWRHPEKGLISPEFFIALAEETGLIEPIGNWVLETAFAQMQQWQDEGCLPIVLSINVSAKQLKRTNLPEQILKLSKQYSVDLKNIELELTESAFMEDPAMATAILKKLKTLEISIAIDDFGTGYSSLSYLKNLPINIVKIDRSFIESIDSSEGDAELVSGIIAMTKALKKDTVAEGIETHDQLELLKKLECESGQGYLFAKPLPAKDFSEWIKCR